MAYKFQHLAATMSGSLTQEGDFTVKDDAGVTGFAATAAGAVSGSGTLSAGGALRTAGTVRFDGVADAALDVAADSFYYLDGDSLMKSDTMADYATAIAGDGLAASNGVLSVSLTELTEAAVNVGADSLIFIDADGNVTRRDTFADYATAIAGVGLSAGSGVLALDLNELTAESIASGDFLAFVDSTDNGTHKESIDDIATLFAGNGLVASSAVISIQTSGSALTIASDKLGISGSIAGDCLDKGPGDGVDSIRTLHVVADESTIESVGRASLRIKDDGVTGAKLAPAVAGAGLAQDGSGNLDVGAATNGGIAVNANDIGLDLNDLSAAAVDVSADSIAIVDANDSNATRKESIADLVAGMAGAGLAASAGQLSVQGNSVALKADGDTLVEGYNYFANASSDATVSMPASPSVGDVVTIKAGNLTSGANIIVNRQGSHTIDGLTSIRLESPFASVTCVYVVANDWRIV